MISFSYYFAYLIMGDFMEITIEELINKGLRNIIDIRSNILYNYGSIPNSINIPRNILLLKPEMYLKKNEVYYLYCDEGEFSKKVSKELNEIGYTTYSIKGGYTSYKKLK